MMEGGGERGRLAHLGGQEVFNRGIKRNRRCPPFCTKLEILLLAQWGCNGRRRRLGAGNVISWFSFLSQTVLICCSYFYLFRFACLISYTVICFIPIFIFVEHHILYIDV